MKKLLVLIILILISFYNSRAQDNCLTSASTPPEWIFSKSTKSSQISMTFILNVFVHIVRSGSGQGLSQNITSTIINSLNSNFSETGIQFTLLGSDFIDNDYYYDDFNGKEDELFSVNRKTNAIDIYVLGESTIWIGAGLAQNIPSTAFIVHGSFYSTSSLPHEMGHCLGLYHTHHGTVNEGGGDVHQCAELVNGNNSTTCGDYIADTPADPNQWSRNSCNYIGTGTDSNGDRYNPDVSNIMSYSYKPCRISYSQIQINRMRDFIKNTTILQNTLSYYINGVKLICTSGESFSLENLPANTTVTWSSSSNITFSSVNTGESVTVKASSSTVCDAGWIEATLTNSNGDITLPRKEVWVGKPSFTLFGTTSLDVGAPGIVLVDYSSGDHFSQGIQNSDWSFTGPLDNIEGDAMKAHYRASRREGGIGFIYSTQTNQCGSYENRLFFEVEEPLFMLASPNPANEYTELNFYSANEITEYQKSSPVMISVPVTEQSNGIGEYEIQIWHERKGLVKQMKSRSKKLQIPTNNLDEGIYFLHIIVNGKVHKQQLKVQR
ncbi:hypothetical protein GCQ56_04620 [Marinifilum sp. N1E240]|uniref:M43 family zinc metalloprotease n=1 Tax=Marinifilum sp. N1E240 TaxID=2608082 RepID=UPI00128BE7C3|nr:M43 family zinc metalloprotease [Marinifilum sp. N1E240]MPQ46284.1 hypothetical protein [Marinifilum sp. N1E240]